MHHPSQDRIVERLHQNPALAGVPFEVVEDDDGLHLELDGERLATIPADPRRRRAECDELARRYGISLFDPDAFSEATAEDLEKWLYYAAGFGDSADAVVAWETRRYEARLPRMAAVLAGRVRNRLASPFVGRAGAGASIVESLSFEVARQVRTRESEWSGVPVELETAGYYLDVGIDLDGADDERLRYRLDGQLDVLTDDERADAERLVPPRSIVMVADALTVPWTESTTDEAASQVEAWLETCGEAFVGPALDRAVPGERPFAEGMQTLADQLDRPLDLAVALRYAHLRTEVGS